MQNQVLARDGRSLNDGVLYVIYIIASVLYKHPLHLSLDLNVLHNTVRFMKNNSLDFSVSVTF